MNNFVNEHPLVSILIYIVVSVFLNPMFRKIIRETRGSGLSLKEIEGSVFYSIFWPVIVVAYAIMLSFCIIMVVLEYVWKAGNAILPKAKDNS